MLTSSGTACCSHDKAASGCCVRSGCMRLESLVSAAATGLERAESKGTCVWPLSLLHAIKCLEPLHTMLSAKARGMCKQQQCIFRQTCADDENQKTCRIISFTVVFGSLQGHLLGGLIFEHVWPAASAKALHTHSSTQADFDHGWACVSLTDQLDMQCSGARPGWEPADVLLQ